MTTSARSPPPSSASADEPLILRCSVVDVDVNVDVDDPFA